MIGLVLLSIAACGAMDSSDSMFDVFEDLAKFGVAPSEDLLDGTALTTTECSHKQIGQSGGTKVNGPFTTIKGTAGSILDSLEGVGNTGGGHHFTFADGPFYEIEFWYGSYYNYFGGLRVRNKDGWVTPSGWWATNGPLGYGRGTKESVKCSGGISSLTIVGNSKGVLGVRVGCACGTSGVTFCDSKSLSGTCCTLGVGTYQAGANPGLYHSPCPGNDRVSSIYVPKNMVAKVSEHYAVGTGRTTGTVWELNGGSSGKTFVGGTDFGDNTISGVVVAQGCRDQLVYYPVQNAHRDCAKLGGTIGGCINRCRWYHCWICPKGPCLSASTLAWVHGGCREHFAAGNFLAQYKGQTTESCACKCRSNSQCKMFLFGRADDTSGRAGWCNLYRNVCTNNGDATWDAYKPQ